MREGEGGWGEMGGRVGEEGRKDNNGTHGDPQTTPPQATPSKLNHTPALASV